VSNSYRFTMHYIVQGETEDEARAELEKAIQSDAWKISRAAVFELRQVRISSLLVDNESSAKANRERQTITHPKMTPLLKVERQEAVPAPKKPKQTATWDPVNKRMVFSY